MCKKNKKQKYWFCIFCLCSDAIRDEIKALKKEYKNDRKTKDETIVEEEKSQKEPQNDMVVAYLSEQRKYSSINKDIPKKGDQR